MLRACIAGLALVACADSSTPTSSSFVGNWSCQVAGSASVSAQGTPFNVDLAPHTDKVSITSTGGNALSVDDLASGGECILQASVTNGSAAITGGSCTQSIAVDGSVATFSYKFTGGALDVSGSSMSGTVQASLTGSVGTTVVGGTATQTFTCAHK